MKQYKIKALLSILIFLLFSCADAHSTDIAAIPNTTETLVAVDFMEDSSQNQSTDLSHFYQKDSTKTYSQVKAQLLSEKKKLDPTKISEDSLGNWFCNRLVYTILPYWYGTPWDFNGYTATPNQGVIACGYFISTTLLHMGLNVNRYKLAQQLPVHEAQTLALSDTVSGFGGTDTRSIVSSMQQGLLDGLYFLGFDQSHVGFLLKENDELFVIHSNYIGAQGVVVEPILESAAFASYFNFYVVPISGNKKLMQKWLLGEVITVVEG